MKNTMFLIILAILFSCTESIPPITEITDIPVVQSYIEPGNPVKVKLTKMLPFVEGGNTGLEAIDSAKVYINHNGNDYLLSLINNRGEYESTDTNLQIIPNDTYKLHFEYDNYIVSASTIIPTKPVNTSLNKTKYYIDQNATGPGSATQEPLIVSWSNDNSYHIVIIEYLDSAYDPVSNNLEESTFDKFRKVSTDPIDDGFINLNTRQHLVFFGNYRIIIYKINDEYVNLYENISQNTLNLTEPLTNIENGLGIFSGINSDTLSLEVKRL